MPTAAIESRTQIARADEEMHAMLDRYERMAFTIRKRRPLEVDYYRWEQARPELVIPTVKAALRFVSHVEYPPHLYAQPILEATDRDGVTSLRRFIERIWLPEEIQHGQVLRKATIVYGAASEEEHDLDLAKTTQVDFTIGKGYNSGKVSTFGETQELITKLFYEAMRNNTEDPLLREVIGDIESQEMFHSKGCYAEFRRRFARAEDTVSAVIEFMMPGHITSPELQKLSTGWAYELGFDFKRMRHVLATTIVEQAGYKGLGQVVTSELIRNDSHPLLRPFLAFADRIHNPLLNYVEGRVAAKVAGVKT